MRHHGAWVRQYMRFYAPSSVPKKRNSIGGIPPISRSSRGYGGRHDSLGIPTSKIVFKYTVHTESKPILDDHAAGSLGNLSSTVCERP